MLHRNVITESFLYWVYYTYVSAYSVYIFFRILHLQIFYNFSKTNTSKYPKTFKCPHIYKSTMM